MRSFFALDTQGIQLRAVVILRENVVWEGVQSYHVEVERVYTLPGDCVEPDDQAENPATWIIYICIPLDTVSSVTSYKACEKNCPAVTPPIKRPSVT